MNVRALFAAMALLASSGVVYADNNCSTASLDGRYVTSGHSQFTNPKFNFVDASAAVALSDYDGLGHVTATYGVLNADGTILHFTASGTYVVNADCSYSETSSAVVTLPNGVVFYALPSTNIGVVADHGRRIETMPGAAHNLPAFTETSGLTTATAEKLENSQCRSLEPAEYVIHGLFLDVLDNGNHVAATVVATASGDDRGHLTGNVNLNFGSHVNTNTIDASLVIKPNCTLTWTGAGQGGSVFYGVAIEKSDSIELHMVGGDPPTTDPNTGATLPGSTAEFTAVGTPREE